VCQATIQNKMNCELMLTYDTLAYTCMVNVYKNLLSRQTGSRDLTGPKTLPTIWHTYMKLVTQYQISAINSCWEKCDEKYLAMDGRTDRQKDRGKTVYPPSPLVEWGYNKLMLILEYFYSSNDLQCNDVSIRIFQSFWTGNSNRL
jgi:hypothetical protein